MNFKEMCKRQGELSEAYMRQQKAKRKLAKEKYPPYECVLCKRQKYGFGNNPAPCSDTGVCCDDCNSSKVIPARIALFIEMKMEAD